MELFGILKVILWYCQENENKTLKKGAQLRLFLL